MPHPTRKKARSKRKRWLGDRFTERGYQPYVQAIGQLVLAWNDLHEKLGFLFVTLLDLNRVNAEAADDEIEIERWSGIWASAAYDRPKRSMLQGVLSENLQGDLKNLPMFKEDILWILKEADKIEEIRNNAVHVPLVWMGNHPVMRELVLGLDLEIVPNVRLGHKRGASIAKRDIRSGLLREYRWAREACLVLRDFTQQMRVAVTWHSPDEPPEPSPWPHRPSLPNRGQKKTLQGRPPRAQPK